MPMVTATPIRATIVPMMQIRIRPTGMGMAKEMLAMFKQFTSFVVVMTCALWVGACDNGPPLERTVVRDRGAITAEFYTEDPENIQFPVKVLFAIDCSLSMLESDPIGPGAPAGRRIAAVRDFIDQYNTEEYPSVSFSILLWSASPLERTVNGSSNPGYTRSTEELTRVLDNARTETFTDYLGAMTNIREIVENDIMTTYYQESGANQLARSKYIVCFFSDGMPNTDAGTQAAEDIWQQVEELRLLTEERGVGQFNFHTFFLSSLFRDVDGDYLTQPAELVTGRQYAEQILFGMAQRGNGTFRDFAAATSIDFINFTDLRLANEYKIKYIVAYNYMVRPDKVEDLLSVDSDGDGLTDLEEMDVGTLPDDRDTDDDGLSDYFEIKVQSRVDEGDLWPDPIVADSSCPPPPGGVWPDQDNDGMTDCEESIKGTWRFVADFDADYIPDGIEMACGTNPFENLYVEDSDLDSVLDIFEVRNHTNVLTDDPILRDRYAYHYSQVDHGHPDPIANPDIPQGVRRYTINITNISLMDTVGALPNDIFNGGQALLPGDNVIRLYIAQVPEDRPNSPPVFRMAEITINTLQDDTYSVTLSRDQFELID
jgi:hypothetical protein